MKKSIIAGAGVAAVSLAAMPILGAFAATSTVTDEITVNIASSCAVTTSGTSGTIGDGTATTNTYVVNMQNSQLKSDIGASNVTSGGNVISVVCNDASASSTWKLTAVGGDGTTVSTVMDAAGSGTDIATGTAASGAVSNWAFKVTGGTGVTIQNGYDSFIAVPGTPAVIAEGTGSVAGAFTPTYQVWISAGQEADSYTGKVTYTLTSPNV